MQRGMCFFLFSVAFQGPGVKELFRAVGALPGLFLRDLVIGPVSWRERLGFCWAGPVLGLRVNCVVLVEEKWSLIFRASRDCGALNVEVSMRGWCSLLREGLTNSFN